jgi:hypothetical protein
MRRGGTWVKKQQHAGVPLGRVRAGELRWEEFLYELKAGPAGSRLRRPPSRRQRHDSHRRTDLSLDGGNYVVGENVYTGTVNKLHLEYVHKPR